MPQFSFTPVVKPSRAKSYSESTSKYNILFKDVEGVVFIDVWGKYHVVVGEDHYDIVTECFSCKGHTEIYELELTNDLNRVRHIRSADNRSERDTKMYLPFTAGCCVVGNIVRWKAANVVLFKIKKVYIDNEDPIARLAIKFYRDNYDTIKKAIFKDMIDNYEVDADQTIIKEIREDTDELGLITSGQE